MNLVNTPEARRALAALALLDSESGKLKRLGLPTRRAVSAIESFCVTAGNLAVFPLSEITTPAREELANVREAQSSTSRTVPMSGATGSEKSAASDSAAPASRSSPARRSAKPNDRSIPPVSASSAELRRSNDRHSTAPPRQISTGSGFSPDNDLLEAEGLIGKPHTQQVKNAGRVVDPTIGSPMNALSQLIQKIEAKKVSGKGVRRDDGAMHSAQGTTRSRPERTAERHTDRSDVSTYQSSAPKGSGSIQSTGNHLERHFTDSSPFHPLSDAVSDSFVPYFAGTETNRNTETTEESNFVEELANNAPDQGAGRSLPFSSSSGFPVGQRIPGEFPQSAAGSDAYDPGEQLADLINDALQAQARRRGIS